MKRQKLNESGLVPLLIAVFMVVAGLIYIAFTRVKGIQK
jgi:hypothetical protein